MELPPADFESGAGYEVVGVLRNAAGEAESGCWTVVHERHFVLRSKKYRSGK